MQRDWWLALPNGQRFNMTGEEIARKIEAGEIEPNLLGSYQGGPYVPLIQSPAFRQAYDRRQARLIEKQKAESRKFFKVMAVMGGVAFAGIVLFGIAATVINNVAESNRVEREQREKAKIQEEERQVAEKKKKTFDEMPPAQKIEKAKELASTGLDESIQDAYRYLDAVPAGDKLKSQAERVKADLQAKIEKQKKEAAARAAEDSVSPMSQLEVVSSRWEGGGVAVWKVTFRNKGKFDIGDIKYSTVYYSETGNVVDQGGTNSFADRTIQKVIPAGKTRTIEINDGFLHSEAARATFSVESCRKFR